MDQNVLAAAAHVSRGVIIDFEKGKRTPGPNNLTAIRTALEAAGIQFLADGETAAGPGVALRANA
jgi:transcriptional regulator with XRE-family HTH domain